MKQSSETETDNDDNLPIINPNDFKSMTIFVAMTNDTTQTSIRDHKMMYGEKLEKSGPEWVIRFLELQEKGFILDVPKNTCAAGHHLTFEIRTHDPSPSKCMNWEASGNVMSQEKGDETHDKVNIELIQYEEKEWKNFCNLFSSRQDEIEKFFNAAKG